LLMASRRRKMSVRASKISAQLTESNSFVTLRKMK
jgi:hypothetical protein